MKPNKLSCDALLQAVRQSFSKIKDHRLWRGSNRISLMDALMSGYAVFQLKFPSLLAFDKSQEMDDTTAQNLSNLFKIGRVPSDTQMREILDGIDPRDIRPAFKAVFAQAQRCKVLEKYTFMDGRYLLSIDGTGYFSSSDVHCDNCCEKNHRNGKVTYHHQILAACIVHPERKQVIPLAPEAIMKQDGEKKNDCERNAARRMLADLRREHPHLKLIVVEDALSSNGPHIKDLMQHNMNFILGAKPGDHRFIFKKYDEAKENGTLVEIKEDESNIKRSYSFVNNLPLNELNQDLKVNLLCVEETKKGKTTRFSWVSDILITKKNVMQLMQGGRARWKIENETFNTLKNKGYNFEHNFGHGKQHLSTNFAQLMMLAFCVDQLQEIGCPIFNAMKLHYGNTRYLIWEKIRSIFTLVIAPSWADYFTFLSRKNKAKFITNTS
ncbi:MAG TPA: transposase [Flavobacteriales bacterium]|nr:transposase [Flavobacteriales bacterium]HIB83435.1 transposase [Chromatiaceae bacterium]